MGIASDEFSDNLDLVSSDHLHALLSDEFEQFNEEDFRYARTLLAIYNIVILYCRIL